MRSRGRLIEVEAVARRSDGDAINKISLRIAPRGYDDDTLQ